MTARDHSPARACLPLIKHTRATKLCDLHRKNWKKLGCAERVCGGVAKTPRAQCPQLCDQSPTPSSLTTATASKSRSRGTCLVTKGHFSCRRRRDFKASAVQSATIQPQSSVLKEKPPWKVWGCKGGGQAHTWPPQAMAPRTPAQSRGPSTAEVQPQPQATHTWTASNFQHKDCSLCPSPPSGSTGGRAQATRCENAAMAMSMPPRAARTALPTPPLITAIHVLTAYLMSARAAKCTQCVTWWGEAHRAQLLHLRTLFSQEYLGYISGTPHCASIRTGSRGESPPRGQSPAN